MKTSTIIVTVLIVLLLSSTIYFLSKYNSATKSIEQSKLFADSLGTELVFYRTESKIIASKYATLSDINSSLTQDVYWRDKKLTIQQHTILQLKGMLDSAKGEVVFIGDSVISTVHQNTYSDSGVTINLRDSIYLSRVSIKDRWQAVNHPKFDIKLRLTNTIGKEKGVYFGAVEINSPLIQVEDITTIFDSSLFVLPEVKETAEVPSTLALGSA